MKIYVIQESDIGEGGQSYGERYSNLIIFEENEINKIAHKYMIDNKVAERLAQEEDEPIEKHLPKNGQWTFKDLEDELDNDERFYYQSMSHTAYEMNVKLLNLDLSEDVSTLYKILNNHESATSNFPLGFEDDFLFQAFSEDDIIDINIVDKFSLKTIKVIDVKFEDKTIGTIKK